MERKSWAMAALLVIAFAVSERDATADNWLDPGATISPSQYSTEATPSSQPQGDPFVDDPSTLPDPSRSPKSMPDGEGEEVAPLLAPLAEDIDHFGAPETHGGYEALGPNGARCPLRLFSPSGRLRVFGGAEYLHVRPTFSEATAFLERRTEGNSQTDTLVSFDYDYEDSVRAFVGVRLCDCDGELYFTYSNFGGNTQEACGPVPGDLSVICAGQLEVNAGQEGDTLSAASRVNANLYDIDYARTITPCNPIEPCTTCGDGECGCEGCCPPWTLKWSLGVRIADVDWDNDTAAFNAAGDPLVRGVTEMSFDGGGPRVGLEGRRFFGDGRLSMFGRGNLGLLLGHYELTSTRVDDPQGIQINTIQTINNLRIVPVTELEVGGSWETNQFTISAGYLFQAWHDLGMSTQVAGGNFGTFDDANILSFDGFFLRGEFAY